MRRDAPGQPGAGASSKDPGDATGIRPAPVRGPFEDGHARATPPGGPARGPSPQAPVTSSGTEAAERASSSSTMASSSLTKTGVGLATGVPAVTGWRSQVGTPV